MKQRSYFIILFFTAVAALTLLAMQSLNPLNTKPKQNTRTLVAGYTNEPPYAYYDKSGRVQGLFPAALRDMASAMGYEKVEWVMMTFEQPLPALLSNRLDVIAAGLVITEQRKPFGCFLSPLALTHAAVMTEKNKDIAAPVKLESLAQRTLVTLSGSIEETLAVKRKLGGKIERVPDVQAGVSMILTDKADVLLLTRPSLEYRKKQLNSVKVLPIEDLHNEALGPAFLFSHRLQSKLNQAQQAQQRFMRSSQYQQYLSQFGFVRPPSESTATECRNRATS
ncbi:transporter substrate-binding domain-containing protein [Idiomarina seosinensis]|uniref:substrate-binding periplasmic protein n=1 Tax=Idiomarina seosinensis TaxID=281739 RepID=UPI00384AFEF3